MESVLGDFKHLEAGKIGDRRRNGPSEAVERNLNLLDAGKACPQVTREAAVQAVVGHTEVIQRGHVVQGSRKQT